MVLLDHSLIYGARRIMTGANIHQVGTLVFCYEQAVALHNGGYKGHKNYQLTNESMRISCVNMWQIHCRQYCETP